MVSYPQMVFQSTFQRCFLAHPGVHKLVPKKSHVNCQRCYQSAWICCISCALLGWPDWKILIWLKHWILYIHPTWNPTWRPGQIDCQRCWIAWLHQKQKLGMGFVALSHFQAKMIHPLWCLQMSAFWPSNPSPETCIMCYQFRVTDFFVVFWAWKHCSIYPKLVGTPCRIRHLQIWAGMERDKYVEVYWILIIEM